MCVYIEYIINISILFPLNADIILADKLGDESFGNSPKLILVNSKQKSIYRNFILELLPFGEAGQTPF